MDKNKLQEYINKGFDNKKFNKLSSIQILLLRAAEHYNREAADLCQEYGLFTFDNKKKLNAIECQIQKLAVEFNPAINKSNKNVLDMMEDFHVLINAIDKFMGDD